jgi:hypothetical protein
MGKYIYCSECKHVSHGRVEYGGGWEERKICIHPSQGVVVRDYWEEHIQYKTLCQYKNANNDCRDYEVKDAHKQAL